VIPSGYRTTLVRHASVMLMPVPEAACGEDVAVLTAGECARADRFVFARDRAAFVTARAALRRWLGTQLDRRPAEVPLEIDEHGRPHLATSLAHELDFSLSHSGTVAVLATAVGGRIGVDVEWHGRQRTLRDLLPRVMGPQEQSRLATLEGDEFVRAFLGCWTRKEAVTKALGIGLSYPVAAIDVPELDAGVPCRVQTSDSACWTVFTDQSRADLSVSVALAGEPLGPLATVTSVTAQMVSC
jgi:4'-phosphopantetheinyl transferase